ncbi:MAG: glycoside hydrolase family 97 catalytic domain-containing protein, partial [Oscillospiraceae bacterium]|nr:glycoside hydrolase family 97 catalytic domain-containing protein [Oscillospiraceae bacterium]
KSLPDDAKYLYTFEAETLKEGKVSTDAETSVTFDGTQLKSLPELQTVSPDGTLTTKLWTDARGSFYYSVHKKSGGVTGTVIEPSKLGLVTTTEDLSNGLALQAASSTTFDETYSMPYGKHSEMRNHYNEITIPLKKGDSVLTVIFRVYDDGIGFRYALNHGATIKDETSQVVFPTNGTLWGNGPNATYEWNFTEFGMDKVNSAWADYSLPLTGNFNNKYWVLVSEANVFNESDPYCAGCLSTSGGSRAIKWKFGVKTKSVTMNNAFHTPWRAMVVADNLNDMSSSDLILNLNPPSVLKDESWIKPGKSAWSWWSSGGDSPVEYHTQKDYVDFAAANGWDFVCLDFGWALWDDSEAKVREICEYADKKGIGIYLWYGVNNSGHSGYRDSKGNPAYPYYSLLDEATIKREFERISGLGVKGVKVDYYESDTQETMKQMYLCMDIAAKNKLMVLFHGCTLPRGESRTYPNVVSYEAVNGAEYYKWFDSPSLENRISYTFTRNVVGSADFTPTGLPIPDIKATAGFALADLVTIESGIQHYAHSVFRYPGTTALALMNDVPVTWDDLKVLDGRPMQFNVTARRSGSDWYIGASTIKARDVEINLGDLITDDGT